MIIFIILGIISVITIPSMLQNQQESANRTKIKKALTTYEHVIEQMRVIQNLKTVVGTADTALNGWANADNKCTNGKSYFKIIKEDTTNPCIFKVEDGLWWNITTMSQPIVALSYKDEDTIDCRKKVETTEGSTCYNKSFYMITELDTSNANAFITNYIYSDAKYALYYAKIIDKMPSDFDICKAKKSEKCTLNGITYTKKTIDENTEVTSGNSVVGCYSFALKKVTYPCISKVTSNELWYSDIFDWYTLPKSSLTGNTKYDNMKNYCISKGARMATMAEIKAGGYDKLGMYISAAEERDSSSSYYFDISWGFSDIGKTSYKQGKFICIYE